ncbi:hypothetical protein [Rhodococcus wratislaviensis]|nr:hypothetical protein [Rhodococcus wratislaviensis]
MVYKEGSIGLAVVERIAGMYTVDAPWPQRLWRPSAIDALKHCVDLIEGDARDGAKSFAVDQARKRIENDLFIPRVHRGGMLKSLTVKPEKMVRGSATEARLKCVCAELEDSYPAWVQQFVDDLDDSVAVKSAAVDGNALAWQMAAFLRSVGMSDEWIANFHNYHLRHNKEVMSLSETVRLARQASEAGSGWIFLVPIRRLRSFVVPAPPILRRPDFERRFNEVFPGVPIPENRGGLVIDVDTIDKYAAIDKVQFEMRRIIDRHRASRTSRRKLELGGEAWVFPGGWRTAVSLDVRPKVEVRELDALGGGGLFSRASEELEAALDLLTAADRTSPRAATIAVWAVLETLFADESDFGELAVVADRAADILTCLYVKDAFGRIARGHARGGVDELAEQLRGSGESAAALLVEEALPHQAMAVSATLGELACGRAKLLTATEVGQLRSQLAAVLRRLYDMRNQVVHSGRISPFGLDRTYEESTVLISALMDELLKQHRDARRSAREVAGRAAWLLERVIGQRATPASLSQISDS